MPSSHNPSGKIDLAVSVLKRIDDAMEEFQLAWKNGRQPALADYLTEFDGPGRVRLLRILLEIDVGQRRENGESPTSAYYEKQLQGDNTLIQEEFRKNGWTKAPHPTVNHAGGADGRRIEKHKTYQRPKTIDRFRVEEEIGRGGFGWVYKCFDPNMKEDVAVKIPRPDRSYTDQEIDEFLSEAGSATKLRGHDNIVRVREAQKRGSDSFIVSDYIKGNNLANRLEEKPFTPKEAATLIAKVADALHFAHQRHYVHRDIKPGNILLDENDQPYLTDFGMAATEDELYAEGASIRGTPPYVSPEQARGEAHLVGPAADIFSLGIVFYEMLAGQRPFRGKTRNEVLDKIKNQQPRPIRLDKQDVPKKLETICLICLRKNPEQRYSTAEDLASEINAWLRPALDAQHSRNKEMGERILARNLRMVKLALGIGCVSIVTALLFMLGPWHNVPVSDTDKSTPADKTGRKDKGFPASHLPNVPAGELPVLDECLPNRWYELMHVEPEIVLFPKRAGYESWRYEDKQLFVRTDQVSLFGLGIVERSAKYALQISIIQGRKWVGGSGIFFGLKSYKDKNGRPRQKFQFISFRQRSHAKMPRLVLSRGTAMVRTDITGRVLVEPNHFATADLLPISGEQTLELTVDEDLKRVRVGKTEIDGLIGPEHNKRFGLADYQGKFGVMVFAHSSTFRNARFQIP